MESKTSSGQVLVECAIALLCLAMLFAALLEFNTGKKTSKRQIIKSKQMTDLRNFRNEGR